MNWILDLYVTFFGAESVVAPEYLVCFVLIVGALYLIRRERGPFWAYVFPKDVWFTRSARADLILFTMNQLIAFSGIFVRLGVTPLAAFWTAQLVGNPDGQGLMDLGPWGLALLIFVVFDFAQYFIHWWFHNSPTFWPLHAVHHSAAKLNPFTSFRSHPLFLLISFTVQAIILGAVLGLIVGTLDQNLTIAQISGANAFVVVANLLVSHLHHSHVWISFGPVIERVFISPAQHQVHHSVNPEHHNKNYGNTLAIWDWMFGTLYVTGADEKPVFGLEAKADAPLMTQKVHLLLWSPLVRMGKSIRRITKMTAPKP